MTRLERVGEIYFLRKLFFEVLLPEAPLLGESAHSKRFRLALTKGGKLAAPCVILASLLCFSQGKQENLQDLAKVQQDLSDYQAANTAQNPEDHSPESLLPLLSPLSSALATYQKDQRFSLHCLYITRLITLRLQTSLDRALSNLYLPRIAATLENQLTQNILDQNILYATLKGYLAFSASDYTKPYAVMTPMEYLWDQNFTSQPSTKQALTEYLRQALAQALTPLPLDPVLINRVRAQLETIVPADRAYGLLSLHASVSDLAPLNLASASGEHFSDVFASDPTQLTIPTLYTLAGFQEIFLKEYQSVAEEVAQDNHDIGLAKVSQHYQNQENIAAALEKRYGEDYHSAWSKSLSEIHLQEATTLNQAISLLDNILSKTSPLTNLLNLIDDQTHTITHHSIQVAAAFSNLNAVTENSHEPSWQHTEILIQACRDLLTSIQHSSEPGLTALKFLQSAFASKNNAIFELAQASATLPEPLKSWTKSIADLCWQVSVNTAQDYLDARWQAEVMPAYQNSIADRFPLVENARTQIAMTDFNTFFSPNGILQTFFNRYLKSFVDTNHAEWGLLEINGYRVKISPEILRDFEITHEIQTTLFSGSQAQLDFTLKPLTLSSSASGVFFQSGADRLIYQHGPQMETTLHWPPLPNNDHTELVITNFNDDRASKSFEGPWSLFQLLQAGELLSTQNPGQYLWRITLREKTAEFLFTSTLPQEMINTQSFQNFHLLPTLFPTETSHD